MLLFILPKTLICWFSRFWLISNGC